MQRGPVYYGPSEIHRMGVFAAQDLEPGEMIEICPVLLFPREEVEHMDKTILYDYYFDWTETEKAICLGYGSLYNHSYEPNAEYDMDFESQTIDIHCIKPIKAGEEIMFNYNGFPEDKSIVWFEKGERPKI
jgi:uncharacterized protein